MLKTDEYLFQGFGTKGRKISFFIRRKKEFQKKYDFIIDKLKTLNAFDSKWDEFVSIQNQYATAIYECDRRIEYIESGKGAWGEAISLQSTGQVNQDFLST